jgi:hypothetical protein
MRALANLPDDGTGERIASGVVAAKKILADGEFAAITENHLEPTIINQP